MNWTISLFLNCVCTPLFVVYLWRGQLQFLCIHLLMKQPTLGDPWTTNVVECLWDKRRPANAITGTPMYATSIVEVACIWNDQALYP